MKGKLRSTSFRHFALSYTLLAAILIAAMCIYMYVEMCRTVEGEFQSNGQNVLMQAVSAHTQQLDMMKNTVDEIITSSEFSPFLLRDDPLRSQNVIKRLGELKTVNQYYDSVLLFYQQDNYLYTNTTSMEIERFLSAGLKYEHMDAEGLRSVLYDSARFQMLPRQKVQGLIGSRQECVTYVFSLPAKRNTTVMFLASARELNSLFAAEECVYAILSDEHVLFSSEEISDEALMKVVDSGASRMRSGRNEYAVFSRKDELYGLTYCVLRPLGQLRHSLYQNVWKLILFAVGISVSAAFLTAFFSGRFSRRIRKIQHILLPDDSIDDSLDMLESSAIAVMKRKNVLDAAMEENIRFQRDRLVKRVIRGEFDHPAEFARQAAQYRLDFSAPYFCVVLVNAFKDDTSAELHLDDSLFEASVWGIWLTANNQVLYLVNASDREELERKLMKLESMLRSNHENAVVAVSSVRRWEIPTAFLEAQSAFDNRFLLNNNRMLRFDEISQNAALQSYPAAWLDMLKSAIRMGSENQISEALERLMNYAKNSGMSMLSFRLMYNEMIQILLQEYANANVQQDMLRMYSVFSLSHCLTLQELNDMLRDICMLLIRDQRESVDSSELMRTAALYIQQHYQDPEISMSQVAEAHAISSVAFSLRFKETFGMSPSDYLLMLRMQHAQRMLTNTDLPVKQIGQEVGYADFPNFLRRFKAYTAMTPSQYRTASRNENE